MMSRSHRFTVAAAVCGLLGMSSLAQSAVAQITANASVNATAFVSGVAPLTAAGVHDLVFGTVAAGAVKSITNPATDAGRFNIAGQPSTPVLISFVLPSVLTETVTGTTTIPITFGGTDGLHWTAFPTTSVGFNPNAVFATSLDVSGNLVIGIAGTVSPPLGTTTGNYLGVITMTVSY
jgi:hypothetical protein